MSKHVTILPLVIFLLLVLVGCGSKSSSMNLEEFKNAVEPPFNRDTLKFDYSLSSLYKRVGKPDGVYVGPDKVTMTWEIRGGRANVTTRRVDYDDGWLGLLYEVRP